MSPTEGGAAHDCVRSHAADDDEREQVIGGNAARVALGDQTDEEDQRDVDDGRPESDLPKRFRQGEDFGHLPRQRWRERDGCAISKQAQQLA